MSLGNCIPGLVADGKLTKKQGEKAQSAYERHYARFSQEMGPVAAAAEASEAAIRELEGEAKLRRRQSVLQVLSQRAAAADMKKFEGRSPYAAIRAMMGRDIRGPFHNVEASAQRIEFEAISGLHAFIERHRRNLLGRARDMAGLNDVVIELHGDETGNAGAGLFAKAVGETFESLRQRFNSAGGAIARLEGWGLSHIHDTLKVRGTKFATWRQDILAEIAPDRMRDPQTGGAFTPETLEEALKGAYESIRTNGLSAEPGSGFGSKLANRRSDHRFFVFKDGAAWLRYHKKYGRGDPFNVIMAHIRGMAHDIAMMERFGPSPDATVKWLLDKADRIEARSEKPAIGTVTGTSGGRVKAEKLWRSIKGDFSAPVFAEGGGFRERMSMYGVKTMGGIRDLLSAAMLGSAPLTATSDLNTQILARKFNDLPQSTLIMGYAKHLASTKASERAVRLGLGARDASRAMLGMSRYFGESNGPAVTAIFADGVLRLSGLNKFTEAGQRMFGDEMLRELGADRDKGFAELSPDRRRAMARYGIDADTWDKIRAGKTYEEDGAHWLDWKGIEDRHASDKMMDWVLGETSAAVQEASAVARAAMVTDRPGTFWGEVGRNVVQFKSFGIGLLMNQAQRIAALPPRQRLAYSAQFLVGMTLFGALQLQMREVAKGRDPRPMESVDFWMDALVQGGGLGIFGDLFGSFNNDRLDKKSLAMFAAGPMGTLAEDLVGTFGADAKAALAGHPDKEHLGAHLVRMLTRYAPGTNIWYARKALEVELWDRLSEEIDPNYRSSWDRNAENAEKQGQGLWWAHGENLPGRAPDLGRALAEPPPQ